MKQKLYVLFIMFSMLIFSSSAVFAMKGMPSGKSCSMGNMGMGGGMDMSSCDQAACTCNHMESMEMACQPGCACCAMCTEGGCEMGTDGCCDMDMMDVTVDCYPGNLNINSKGTFFTVYIEIEENESQYTIDQIDNMSICLKKANDTMIMINDKMMCTVGPVGYGDYDEDGVPDLMVKFDRQAISVFLLANGFDSGEVSFTVGGQFYDGAKFMGMKAITIQIKK